MNFLKQAQARQQQLIEDVKKIVAFKSLRDDSTATETMPFGKACNDVLTYMLDKAKQDGFKVENVDGYAGVITLGDHEESVSMLGHLDVVPADAREWDSDPYVVVEKNGYLVGRGTGDDKGPTMAAYHALQMIKESNISLSRNIQLIVGVDEESGMQCMHYFKQHHKLPVKGIVPDADFPVVYGEKGILILRFEGQHKTVINSVDAGSRPNVVIGHATFKVNGELKKAEFEAFLAMNHLSGQCYDENDCAIYEIEGKNFHASLSHKGINAALYGLQFIGGFYQDQLALQLHKLLSSPFGYGLGIGFDGAYMGPLTLNLGVIHIQDGNVKLTLDIRYPNECNSQNVIYQIKQQFESLSLHCVQEVDAAPLFVNPNSSLVKTCMEVYQKISKDTQTPPITMGGGTYARTLDNHVAFGAVFPLEKIESWVGGPHEKNEAVTIDSLVKASAIYAEVMVRLANED